MKGFRAVTALLLSLLSTVIATLPAHAQEKGGPLMRGDVYGSLGWFNADKGALTEYGDWYNRSLFGGATFGWYWNDHLKTEVDAGATTAVSVYTGRQIVIDGTSTFVPSHYRFRTRRVAIGQQYQFGDNSWFHPHLAAGVDFTVERIGQRDESVFVFDPQTRQGRQARGPVTHPNRTERHTRPFVAGGFKAYMTPRSFFRSDLRLVFQHGVDEALLRFGFGVDF